MVEAYYWARSIRPAPAQQAVLADQLFRFAQDYLLGPKLAPTFQTVKEMQEGEALEEAA
jgi:hypothetical protein